jgi:hypothetical protein
VVLRLPVFGGYGFLGTDMPILLKNYYIRIFKLTGFMEINAIIGFNGLIGNKRGTCLG